MQLECKTILIEANFRGYPRYTGKKADVRTSDNINSFAFYFRIKYYIATYSGLILLNIISSNYYL